MPQYKWTVVVNRQALPLVHFDRDELALTGALTLYSLCVSETDNSSS